MTYEVSPVEKAQKTSIDLRHKRQRQPNKLSMEMSMNRPLIFVAAAITSLSIFGASVYAAEETDKPPMHMHKSEMNHNKPDKEVAAEYKDEAAVLTEKAQSHRKLARLYRGREPTKGIASYESVAKHCDKLADLYEQAAKEASAVSSELNK
jgi:hypothetical protein